MAKLFGRKPTAAPVSAESETSYTTRTVATSQWGHTAELTRRSGSEVARCIVEVGSISALIKHYRPM